MTTELRYSFRRAIALVTDHKITAVHGVTLRGVNDGRWSLTVTLRLLNNNAEPQMLTFTTSAGTFHKLDMLITKGLRGLSGDPPLAIIYQLSSIVSGLTFTLGRMLRAMDDGKEFDAGYVIDNRGRRMPRSLVVEAMLRSHLDRGTIEGICHDAGINVNNVISIRQQASLTSYHHQTMNHTVMFFLDHDGEVLKITLGRSRTLFARRDAGRSWEETRARSAEVILINQANRLRDDGRIHRATRTTTSLHERLVAYRRRQDELVPIEELTNTVTTVINHTKCSMATETNPDVIDGYLRLINSVTELTQRATRATDPDDRRLAKKRLIELIEANLGRRPIHEAYLRQRNLFLKTR